MSKKTFLTITIYLAAFIVGVVIGHYFITPYLRSSFNSPTPASSQSGE